MMMDNTKENEIKSNVTKYCNLWRYGTTEKSDKRQRIPNKGEKLMFFDDGKIRLSRMYQAEVIAVHSPENTPSYVKRALNENDVDWVFIKEEDGTYSSDVFIECSIPKYDENSIWFARTKDGGFFSIDIQSDWQGGILDADGRLEGYINSLND